MGDRYIKERTTTTIRQRTTPILQLSQHLQTTKRKRTTPIPNVGPHHQSKAWSPGNPYKQNHLTLPNQTTGTVPIPKRTHKTRNDTAIKKPLCHVILLYKEEKWEASTSPGLSTGQLMDDQKPIPITPHPITNQPTMRLHAVHGLQHQIGVQ